MWFIVSYIADGIKCRKRFNNFNDAMRFCRSHADGTLEVASL